MVLEYQLAVVAFQRVAIYLGRYSKPPRERLRRESLYATGDAPQLTIPAANLAWRFCACGGSQFSD